MRRHYGERALVWKPALGVWPRAGNRPAFGGIDFFRPTSRLKFHLPTFCIKTKSDWKELNSYNKYQNHIKMILENDLRMLIEENSLLGSRITKSTSYI